MTMEESPTFSGSHRGFGSARSRVGAAQMAQRTKVDITQEDLNALIRKWQGEVQGFHYTGSYEDIVRLNVNFLTAVNAVTARLSAKDIQAGLKKEIGEVDATAVGWSKMMVEALAWCNRRTRNKTKDAFSPAVLAVINARGGEFASSPGASSSRGGGTPPSAAKSAAAASGGPAPSSGRDEVLALYGVKSPPKKRQAEDGMQIILSQETVLSSPTSVRKRKAGWAISFHIALRLFRPLACSIALV